MQTKETHDSFDTYRMNMASVASELEFNNENIDLTDQSESSLK